MIRLALLDDDQIRLGGADVAASFSIARRAVRSIGEDGIAATLRINARNCCEIVWCVGRDRS